MENLPKGNWFPPLAKRADLIDAEIQELAQERGSALRTPICHLITMDAPARVIEILQEKAPHLMGETPLILTLCELYHQRKLKEVKSE